MKGEDIRVRGNCRRERRGRGEEKGEVKVGEWRATDDKRVGREEG